MTTSYHHSAVAEAVESIENTVDDICVGETRVARHYAGPAIAAQSDRIRERARALIAELKKYDAIAELKKYDAMGWGC